jgi:hypothetical protein
MTLFSWLRKRTATSAPQHRPTAARFRPQLEALEDRTLPSTFYAATASDLIKDINTANQQGGTNTIVLTAPTTSPYVMTKVDNTTDGPTALPKIASGDNLTILTSNGTTNPGYGDILDAGNPPNSITGRNGRLFDVAQGASLTLENVTLQNGLVFTPVGTGIAEKGGAIYNQGTLILNNVMVQNNAAIGWPLEKQSAAGGAIWSNGSLTVENGSVFQGNSATGSQSYATTTDLGNAYGGAIYIAGGTANITDTFFGEFNQIKGNLAQGANAYGGAIYIAGGTVTLSSDTVGKPETFGANSNTAQAPSGNPLGRGYGGGLYVAGGSVTLTNDTIESNKAGGYFSNGVYLYGYGGGIFIASSAEVALDTFTLDNTQYNVASWFPNIDGTYTLRT